MNGHNGELIIALIAVCFFCALMSFIMKNTKVPKYDGVILYNKHNDPTKGLFEIYWVPELDDLEDGDHIIFKVVIPEGGKDGTVQGKSRN